MQKIFFRPAESGRESWQLPTGRQTVLGLAGLAAIAGSAESAEAATIHEVQHGETLSRIAHIYGLRSWTELVAANPELDPARGGNPHRIHPGQQITIPASQVAAAEPARQPNPALQPASFAMPQAPQQARPEARFVVVGERLEDLDPAFVQQFNTEASQLNSRYASAAFRHLNPGNVKARVGKTEGVIGNDSRGHAQFDSIERGVATHVRWLLRYATAERDIHGRPLTMLTAIQKYLGARPGSTDPRDMLVHQNDGVGDVASYLEHVCTELGCRGEETLAAVINRVGPGRVAQAFAAREGFFVRERAKQQRPELAELEENGFRIMAAAYRTADAEYLTAAEKIAAPAAIEKGVSPRRQSAAKKVEPTWQETVSRMDPGVAISLIGRIREVAANPVLHAGLEALAERNPAALRELVADTFGRSALIAAEAIARGGFDKTDKNLSPAQLDKLHAVLDTAASDSFIGRISQLAAAFGSTPGNAGKANLIAAKAAELKAAFDRTKNTQLVEQLRSVALMLESAIAASRQPTRVAELQPQPSQPQQPDTNISESPVEHQPGRDPAMPPQRHRPAGQALRRPEEAVNDNENLGFFGKLRQKGRNLMGSVFGRRAA